MVHVSERLFSESVKLKRCKGYNCVFTVKTEVTLLLCCRVLYHLPQACFHRNYPGKACPSIPCLPIKAFLLVSENSWDMVRPMKGSFLQAPHYLCSQNWRKVEKLWGGDRWCCPVSLIRSLNFEWFQFRAIGPFVPGCGQHVKQTKSYTCPVLPALGHRLYLHK